jgi:hypothetical protein
LNRERGRPFVLHAVHVDTLGSFAEAVDVGNGYRTVSSHPEPHVTPTARPNTYVERS